MERLDDDGQTHAGSGMEGATNGGATNGGAIDRGATLPDEEVRRRAYELYQARGGSGGSDVDDWLAAEREVRARAASSGRGDAGSRDAGASSGDRAPMGDMPAGDAGESRGESESRGATRATRTRGEKPGRRGRAD